MKLFILWQGSMMMTQQIIKFLGLLALILFAEMSVAAAPFTPNSQPIGWLASPSLTSINVKSGERIHFRLNLHKSDWGGDLLARHISAEALIQPTGPWDAENPTLVTAASQLDSLDFNTGRKIVTAGGPFRWDSLTAHHSEIGNETDGPKIVDFIRGDRSNEGGIFRARTSVLGDILHSSALYWKHDASTQHLYVGANDGMLHVFDVSTGSEVFAYIPSMVIPNLKKLVRDPYSHTYFVDGQISIKNIDLGTTKTILVGGLGAGGKGIYALDVTSPAPTSEADAADKILWEISATGSFSNLGYSYSSPKITRLQDGTAVAIFGNGYMNSGDGHATLYVVDIETGALIHEINTGSGSTTSPNGLSTPTLVNVNGKVRFVYAGDIDGDLWKFDLTSASPAAEMLFTTDPAQAITVAPVVHAHPFGGNMVVFGTGRVLTTGDLDDTSDHYVYGIWDGAPNNNDQLLIQTLSLTTFGDGNVRTITNNLPNWAPGAGHHRGWKVALPAGDRVVGEAPLYNNGRYYFLSTNPTIVNTTPPNGENWLYELDFITGGGPSSPIFDLNKDDSFNDLDLASNHKIPVAKHLGPGIFSQPRLAFANGFSTTLYTFFSDVPDATVLGVAGGHFDFDIYYYTQLASPTSDSKTNTICADDGKVKKENGKVSPTYCTTANGFLVGHGFMTSHVKGASCGDSKNDIALTCNTYSSVPGGYDNQKHNHEYDDEFNVTGVNMLNASNPLFNLSPNVIKSAVDTVTEFKVLVMNQYLNPAALLSVGGEDYESVKTYNNLASELSASALLNPDTGLPSYTRSNIGTLIYNLPLDAFRSKDWWGDGGASRAGLIPTQTGCVNKVNANGSMLNDTNKGKGMPGPNGERFNGALTIQLIKADTPASALELNYAVGGAKYGWRVKQSEFTNYVIAEYTSFWHHPNKACYGDADWVPDPAEDPSVGDKTGTPAQGSADPKDGIFSGGFAIDNKTVSIAGMTTTTVITYSDGLSYTKVEVKDGSTTTVRETLRDGSTTETIVNSGSSGTGFIDPSLGSPEEQSRSVGRMSWRELVQ